MQTLITSMNALKAHPAQMRTQYDLVALATLTLQIYERGLDSWQPIVATTNGHDGTYYIVSGHRRQMGQLLAWELAQWLEQNPDHEITLDGVQAMLSAFMEEFGSLANTITALQKRYGTQPVTIVPFAGTLKETILALQAANYGREEADMLGIAHSFAEAVKSGASPIEIARNIGQSLGYVENHLALTKMDTQLAQWIGEGRLPLSVARLVADLPFHKGMGLTLFILANDPQTLTVKALKECAQSLKQWTQLTVPLTVAQQSQRNIARALSRLWQQMVTAHPADAYAALVSLIYRQHHEHPWLSQEKTYAWLHTLGGNRYCHEEGIRWDVVVAELVLEVHCDHCPVSQLPQPPLQVDLSEGQGGVLGMPCRVGEDAVRCIHGLAASDPMDIRVPWSWGEHQGVLHEGGYYRVKSWQALEHAWQAQATQEARLAESPGKQTATSPVLSSSEAVTVTSEIPPPSNNQSQPPTTTTADSPIMRQRQQIQAYMQQHTQLAVQHPFATPCHTCRHHLPKSPTQDEQVPHCAWASRIRRVGFKRLEPLEGKGPIVPVCRQYAPAHEWKSHIPAHPMPPDVPRSWLTNQILQLVQAGQVSSESYHPFEFLTGRPMKRAEQYSHWFADQLQTHIGELSQSQLWTLFVWAMAEWPRGQGRSFQLPTNQSGVQFMTYQMVSWLPHQEEEE